MLTHTTIGEQTPQFFEELPHFFCVSRKSRRGGNSHSFIPLHFGNAVALKLNFFGMYWIEFFDQLGFPRVHRRSDESVVAGRRRPHCFSLVDHIELEEILGFRIEQAFFCIGFHH